MYNIYLIILYKVNKTIRISILLGSICIYDNKDYFIIVML